MPPKPVRPAARVQQRTQAAIQHTEDHDRGNYNRTLAPAPPRQPSDPPFTPIVVTGTESGTYAGLWPAKVRHWSGYSGGTPVHFADQPGVAACWAFPAPGMDDLTNTGEYLALFVGIHSDGKAVFEAVVGGGGSLDTRNSDNSDQISATTKIISSLPDGVEFVASGTENTLKGLAASETQKGMVTTTTQFLAGQKVLNSTWTGRGGVVTPVSRYTPFAGSISNGGGATGLSAFEATLVNGSSTFAGSGGTYAEGVVVANYPDPFFVGGGTLDGHGYLMVQDTTVQGAYMFEGPGLTLVSVPNDPSETAGMFTEHYVAAGTPWFYALGGGLNFSYGEETSFGTFRNTTLYRGIDYQFAAGEAPKVVGGVVVGKVSVSSTGSGSLVFASTPTLTNPDVGTQTPGDNSNKAASTAYADAAVAASVAATTVLASYNSGTKDLTITVNGVSTVVNLT